MTITHCIVVDTNVLAVAEGLHGGASEECILACVRLLRRIEHGHRIAVDSSDAILREYLGALRASEKPGLATRLARFLWRRRFDAAICHQISITSAVDPSGAFEEVPSVLRDFDVDDQKFLAVAAAEGSTPPLFQALDGEWWNRRQDMTEAGLDVQFLCVAELL